MLKSTAAQWNVFDNQRGRPDSYLKDWEDENETTGFN